MQHHPVTRWRLLARGKDSAALDDLLDEHVAFCSPVDDGPLQGRCAARLHRSAAIGPFFTPDFRYSRETHGPEPAVPEYDAVFQGISVRGVDIVSWSPPGLITAFSVLPGPLSAAHRLHDHRLRMLMDRRRAAT